MGGHAVTGNRWTVVKHVNARKVLFSGMKFDIIRALTETEPRRYSISTTTKLYTQCQEDIDLKRFSEIHHD